MIQTNATITYLKNESDTLIVRLKPAEPIDFLAGQYLLLATDSENFKPFSIASTPFDKDIELHIRDNSDHPYAPILNGKYAAQESVAIRAPAGECTLQRINHNRPILFIAGGTGFAPCHAMIKALFANDNRPSISLYWGAAHANELYFNTEMNLWATQQPGFVYVPVVQFPDPTTETSHRIGLVHQAVLDDQLTLSNYDIYISGSAVMVGHVHHALVQQGADVERIYSDMLDLNLAQFPCD